VADVTVTPAGPVVPPKRLGSRLDPLFGAGLAPTLPRAAAQLRLGMPLGEARRAAPELFAAAPAVAAGFGDVRLKGDDDGYGRLGAVVVLLPRASALADVIGLWGQPVKGFDKGAGSSLYWWFDPTARLRARLEDDGRQPDTSRLVFEAYLPVAALLGLERDKLGFEKEPLLGMTEERVAQVYRDLFPPEVGAAAPEHRICRSQILMLPPVEHDGVGARLRVHCGGSRVSSYEVLIRYASYFAQKDEIARLLLRKLGEPVKKKDVMGREVLEYPASAIRVRFRAEDTVKDAIIEVVRAAPAAPEASGGW
jgi:hypothetical protein